MIIICVLCSAKVVSEAKYEWHLRLWHRISVSEERRIVLCRTKEKDYLEKNKTDVNGEISVVNKFCGEIEKTLEYFEKCFNELAAGKEHDIENESIKHKMEINVSEEVDVYAVGQENIDVSSKVSSKDDDFCIISDVTTITEDRFVENGSDSTVHVPDVLIISNGNSSKNVNNNIGYKIDDVVIEDIVVEVTTHETPTSDEGIDLSSKLIDHVNNNIIIKKSTSLPWYEGEHHACQVCRASLSLGNVESHLSSSHRLTMDLYKKHYNLSEVDFNNPNYQCGVCGQSIQHTYKSIQQHLQSHGVDIKFVSEDTSKYNIETETDVAVNVREKMEDSTTRGQLPLKSSMNKVSASYLSTRSAMKKISNETSSSSVEQPPFERLRTEVDYTSSKLEPSPSKRLRSEVDPAGSSVEPSPFKRLHTEVDPAGSSSVKSSPSKRLRPEEDSTANLFRIGNWLRCLECNKVTTLGRFFTSHVRKHKMTKKQYLEKYPEEKENIPPDWKCAICCKKFKSTSREIATHVIKAHFMTMEEFSRKTGASFWATQHVCNDEEIVLDGEPEVQRLDTTQDITDALEMFELINF